MLRDFLRRKRIESGISQRTLSKQLDDTYTFVTKYESGERYLLFSEVIRICELLKVDVDEISHLIRDLIRKELNGSSDE